MLAGELDADPLVILPALQAAGLLDEETCGDTELRLVRSRLLDEAGAHPEELARLTAQVELAVGLVDAEDRVDALHRLVALGGLANALPAGRARDAAEGALAAEEADLALADLDDPVLRAAAAVVTDALDLDADHPLAVLLSLVTTEVAVPSEEAFAAGVRSAEAELLPGLLRRWATHLSRAWADWVEGVARQPSLALGGVGEPAPIVDRLVIERTDRDELCLLRIVDELALEWMGDDAPPLAARLGGVALRELPGLVAGSCLWPFGEPPVGPAIVSITFVDAERTVRLDAR